MALTTTEKKRIETLFSAERANFANFAIALNILTNSKKNAEKQYKLYLAKQPSVFKSTRDYNAFVDAHNKRQNKWLELKNAYTQRQLEYRKYPDAVLREGNDKIIQSTIQIFNNMPTDGMGYAFIVPVVIVAISLIVGGLSTWLLTKDKDVLADYKELASLTQELAKTNPELAADVMKNYQGAVISEINANPDISTQIGSAVKGLLWVAGIGIVGFGGFKLYQHQTKKNK